MIWVRDIYLTEQRVSEGRIHCWAGKRINNSLHLSRKQLEQLLLDR